MTIITYYKLIHLTTDTANFEITQVYKMKTDVTGYKVKAKGDGKSLTTYDVKNNFYLNYQMDTNMYE
jgi:hypothetical protein